MSSDDADSNEDADSAVMLDFLTTDCKLSKPEIAKCQIMFGILYTVPWLEETATGKLIRVLKVKWEGIEKAGTPERLDAVKKTGSETGRRNPHEEGQIGESEHCEVLCLDSA